MSRRLVIWMPQLQRRRFLKPSLYRIVAWLEQDGEPVKEPPGNERKTVAEELNFLQAYAICECHNIEARAFMDVPDPEDCP